MENAFKTSFTRKISPPHCIIHFELKIKYLQLCTLLHLNMDFVHTHT